MVKKKIILYSFSKAYESKTSNMGQNAVETCWLLSHLYIKEDTLEHLQILFVFLCILQEHPLGILSRQEWVTVSSFSLERSRGILFYLLLLKWEMTLMALVNF